MFNIIENPETKELFLDGNGSIYAFDGTPYTRKPECNNWKIIDQAPSISAWFDCPGNYGTYNGTMTVSMLTDESWSTFEMGEALLYLRNWLSDTRENYVVTTNNEKAYSCRNIARSKASA